MLKAEAIVALFALTLCLAVSGCITPTPGPSQDYGSGYGTNTNHNGGYATDTSPSGGYATDTSPSGSSLPDNTASAADTGASNAVVIEAVSAIQLNDPDTFTSLMSAETLAHVSGTPDLTTPEAKKIGEALQNARIVRAVDDAFMYETTMDGVLISFTVIKEDGEWKIAGL